MHHFATTLALLTASTAAAWAQLQPPFDPPIPPHTGRDPIQPPFGAPDGPGFDLDWYTIDGGGATFLTGASFELGSTIGQPDAGEMSGGAFTLSGGFWHGAVSTGTCYANCDNSTGTPMLTGNDFTCFINAYAFNLPYANCDGSTGTPALTANDFTCFINAYAFGCT